MPVRYHYATLYTRYGGVLECDLMFGEGKEVGDGDMVELNLTGRKLNLKKNKLSSPLFGNTKKKKKLYYNPFEKKTKFS